MMYRMMKAYGVIAGDLPSLVGQEYRRGRLAGTHRNQTTTTPAPAIPQVTPSRNNTITVGGFDSGSIMANQMQVAFSQSGIRGAALASGVPYICGQGNIGGSTLCMDAPEDIVVEGLASQAALLAADGLIDPLIGMASQFTVIQSSADDAVINHQSTVKMAEMNAELGGSSGSGNIQTIFNITANHAFVTDSSGNPCDYLGSPYVSNCNYNFAQVSMEMLWQSMGFVPNTSQHSGMMPDIAEFDQTMYGASVSDNSMDTTGFVFIPPQCLPRYATTKVYRRDPISHNVLEEGVAVGNGKSCHIHVHYHGCMQSRSTLGSGYVDMIPITNFAMNNDVIVLFPQAAPNALKYNPLGCWDWFGYNDSTGDYLQYATKTGIQMQIVRLMVNALIAGV